MLTHFHTAKDKKGNPKLEKFREIPVLMRGGGWRLFRLGRRLYNNLLDLLHTVTPPFFGLQPIPMKALFLYIYEPNSGLLAVLEKMSGGHV